MPPLDGRQVLLVTPGGLGERGGIGRLVNHIVAECGRDGGGPNFTIIDPYGPRNLAVAPFFFLYALVQISWRVLRGRVALAHINIASWGSVVRKGLIVHLLTALGTPIVLHLHAGDFEAFYASLPRLGKQFVRGVFARSDRLIVLGDVWSRFLQDLGIPARRILTVENAIAGPRNPPARQDAGRACKLLFLGRIEAEKGIPELLEALSHPRLAALEWEISLAGAGEIASFQAMADRLGLGRKVQFLGWQPEEQALELLAASDVFVLPSHFEGLSMAILEAMAHGLAIVCTPVGSLPSAVEDGISALFVPIGEVEPLAEALARVIEDPALRRSLQSAARAQFNRKFDIGRYCSTLRQVYGEVLREHSGP